MTFPTLLPGGLALLVSALLLGQSPAAAAGIPGTLDPATGAFHPTIVQRVTPGTATISGEFVADFTITIASSIPTSTKITCTFTATDIASTGAVYIEVAEVAATRSGSSATCQVILPYSWIGGASSDPVELGASISTSTAARLWDHSLPSITAPADGAHTHVSIPATI